MHTTIKGNLRDDSINAYIEGLAREDGSLLIQAIRFLQSDYAWHQSISGPVALLQRRFRLGYEQGLRIAQHLDRLGIWKVCDIPRQGRTAYLSGMPSNKS